MSKDQEFAICCDKNGLIQNTLLNSCGFDLRQNDFLCLVENSDLTNAISFLHEVQKKGCARKKLILLSNKTMFFCGTKHNKLFFVTGSISEEKTQLLHQKLQTEQNFSNIATTSQYIGNDSSLYEEMTYLNNELINTQRKLEQKNIELSSTIEELKATRQKLVQSEKMASLGRLVTGFAHEINTPIGIALTAVSKLKDVYLNIQNLLLEDEVEEEDLEKELNKIPTSVELTMSNLLRAGQLVSSFRRTSIDQNKDCLRLFCVWQIVEDVILSLGSKLIKEQIIVNNRCCKELNIYGYPGILSQILINFVLNSYTHSFDKGKNKGNIEIDIVRKQENYILTYSDDGKGMDKEVSSKIFEPFFTTNRNDGGSGLGLYICYNLVVDQLNGTLSCKTSLGKGAIFEVVFPVIHFDQEFLAN